MSKQKKIEDLTPQTANTTKKICQLKRDNLSTKKSWILIEESKIHISNQVSGEERTGHVVLTKREFNRFIKFYLTGK